MRRWTCLILLLFILSAGWAGLTGCSRQPAPEFGGPAASEKNVSTGQLEDPAVDGSPAINSPDTQADSPMAADDQPEGPGQDAPAPVPTPAKEPQAPEGTVNLCITSNFGSHTILAKTASVHKDWTVIDLLSANTSITTKWDGSFIQGIGGLESDDGGLFGERKDWFYFVNGICADVGAAGYNLQAGETVWWDYHPWKSMGSANSAVIGCYPEPFIHGYRGQAGPTVIMAAGDSQELAAKLQIALKNKGAAAVKVMELNNDYLDNRNGPVIVVGAWSQVKLLPWLAGLNEAYRKTGISVYFKDGSLDLLDYKGDVARTVTGSAGIIAACGSGLGDASPVWLLVGTDQAGVQQAVDTLVNNPQAIRQFFSAAIADGQIIRLPLQ